MIYYIFKKTKSIEILSIAFIIGIIALLSSNVSLANDPYDPGWNQQYTEPFTGPKFEYDVMPPCDEFPGSCEPWKGKATEAIQMPNEYGLICNLRYDYYWRTCKDGCDTIYYDIKITDVYWPVECGDYYYSMLTSDPAYWFDQMWNNIIANNRPWDTLFPSITTCSDTNSPNYKKIYYRRAKGACYGPGYIQIPDPYGGGGTCDFPALVICNEEECWEIGTACWEIINGKRTPVFKRLKLVLPDTSNCQGSCVPVCN